MDKLERVARAICAEKCAFMGEPPCYSVEGEWPNPNCQEPGCHAEAQAAIAALEPVTVQEAALVLLDAMSDITAKPLAEMSDAMKIEAHPAILLRGLCAALRALAQKDAGNG